MINFFFFLSLVLFPLFLISLTSATSFYFYPVFHPSTSSSSLYLYLHPFYLQNTVYCMYKTSAYILAPPPPAPPRAL
jgi:hypothetical protein